jgi:hypothetical protein
MKHNEASASAKITILLATILAVFAAVLHLMGRVPWCTCGFGLWTSGVWGIDTSQNLADPYSTSHILHGIIFYLALWYFTPRIPVRYRLILAVLLEIAWEILENSPFIINRYRTITASLNYYGDSILNSTGDVLCAILGFWLSYKLPWKVTLAISIAIEIIMLILYRDNLTLNVLMLLYPVEAIKNWQMVVSP